LVGHFANLSAKEREKLGSFFLTPAIAPEGEHPHAAAENKKGGKISLLVGVAPHY
jgi:hypothetical protein